MSGNTLHPLEESLYQVWPPSDWSDVTVLLAVSGGPDSVALLRAMEALKRHQGEGRICVAHFNHKMRSDSDLDERFVADLSQKFGLQYEIGCNNASLSPDEGSEETLRQMRYVFLNETAGRLGARFIATAHTADDQAETILHRIVRGTGIVGLAGMARSRSFGPATLIRPMLGIRRAEILKYLNDLGQDFRTDSTNSDRRFTRNHIRHELLPMLAENYNANVVDAILRLGGLADEVRTVIDDVVVGVHGRIVRNQTAVGVEIDAEMLAQQPRYLLREVLLSLWRAQSWPLQAMGFAQWEQLAQMVLDSAASTAGTINKRCFPGNVLVEVGNGILSMSRYESTMQD